MNVIVTTEKGLKLPCFVVKPEGAPKGGVVVLHEAFGVTPHIIRVCERFAAEGYVAIAPGLFAAVTGPDVPVMAQDKEGLEAGRDIIVQVEDTQVLDMVAACRDWLAAGCPPCADGLPAEAGRDGEALSLPSTRKGSWGKLAVALAGYCWGGSCSYGSASRLDGIAACVAYYGGQLERLAAAAQPDCPTIVHLARLDRYIPVDAAVAAFAEHDPAAAVHVYEADHGFNRDDGKTFDPAASALAWQRTLELLNKAMH